MMIKSKDGINTPERLTYLPENNIFVFGSSLRGKRVGGAALDAKVFFGAETAIGRGLTGQSYALPTVGVQPYPLTPQQIKNNFIEFFKFAWDHPELEFWVTKIGCGIAGYEVHTIKRLVEQARRMAFFVYDATPTDNIHYPIEFTDDVG